MATSNGAPSDNRFFQMAQPVSYSTKTPLRFGFAAALWLAAVASAFAQEAPPDIILKLSPAQVVEIGRLIDLGAPGTFVSSPPAAYWDLQVNIQHALAANPAASLAVLSARSAVR